MTRPDPIATAWREYEAEMRRISADEARTEARQVRRLHVELQGLMRREIVRAYFHRLNRLGVAVYPDGAWRSDYHGRVAWFFAAIRREWSRPGA